MNLNNQANYLEDLFGNIFNVAYGYDVKNINENKSNEDAVDLKDETAKIVLQVTTQNSGFTAKRKHTTKGFLNQPEFEEYKKIYVLFLTEKNVGMTNIKKEVIKLGKTYEGIDLVKFLNKIKTIRAPLKQQVLELLQEEQNKINGEPSKRLDPVVLKSSASSDLEHFLSFKYTANTGKSEIPSFLNRKVKRFNDEMRVTVQELQETALTAIKDQEVVVGDLGSLIASPRPTFIFGEMGSGKSTMLAEYFWRSNNESDDVYLLIPANLIKGQITEHASSVITLLTTLITRHLLLEGSDLAVTNLLKEQIVILGFDGIDELAAGESSNLVKHLVKLVEHYNKLTVIGTGRPIELLNTVNRREWNCLSTMDLSVTEMTQLLINEALAEGKNPGEASADASSRISFIKSRADLMSLAVTPLVLTMVRDHLSELSLNMSLGDILYKVIKARLNWDNKEQKKYAEDFYKAYPSVFEREKFIASLSNEIQISDDKTITDDRLHILIGNQVTANDQAGKQLVFHIIEFLKSTFLQRIADRFSFVSQPLLDCAYGIYLADNFLETPASEDFVGTNWRSISISAAVIRARGEVSAYVNHFVSLQECFLTKEDHTTRAAVIVQELRDQTLGLAFINQLQLLRFRPLRTWKDQDDNLEGGNSFSPIALASAINIAGELGFNWFFNEYLDPVHPINMYELGLSSNLLLFYLLQRDFKLTDEQKAKIVEIINYHLHYQTFACSNLLPVISLLAPEEFSALDRASLHVSMLQKDAAFEKAEQLIDKLVISDGPTGVLKAIEIYSSDTETHHKSRIIRLWYKYHVGPDMNDAILKGSIASIVTGGDEDLFGLLQDKIGKQNLFAYLKLLCLSSFKNSDECAIMLYQYFGQNDFYLVARPILMYSKWHQGSDPVRRAILDQILFNDHAPRAHLITQMHMRGRDDLPLLCFEYMVRSFQFLSAALTGMFHMSVTFLPKYALTRNPNLREAIRNLLKQKQDYYQTIKNAALSLDMKTRRHAQQILISCLPENCADELIAVARGALDKLPREDEWLAFIYKLDFPLTELRKLHAVLPTLNVYGKTFGLIILYRNNYPLSKSEMKLFAECLMGKGQYYDYTGRFLERNRLLADSKFLPILLNTLHEDTTHQFDSVASLLLEFHKRALSIKDFLYCTVLQIESYHHYIFDFVYGYIDFLRSDDGKKELQPIIAAINEMLGENRNVTEVLVNAINGDEDSWISLYEILFFKRDRFEDEWVFQFYAWLTNIRKSYPDLTVTAGKAALRMADAPANQEGFRRKSPAGVLILFADEFYEKQHTKMLEVITSFDLHKDLYPTLARRLGYIPENAWNRSRGSSFLPLFKDNPSHTIRRYMPAEISSFLTTGLQLPNGFNNFLQSIILFGDIDNSFIERKDHKPLEALVALLVAFFTSENVDFTSLLSIIDEFRDQSYLKEFDTILQILKEIQLNQPNGKAAYAIALEQRILLNDRKFLREIAFFYKELFELNIPLSFELLKILIDSVVLMPHILDMDLLYDISEHIATDLSREVHLPLAEEIYVYITSFLDLTDEGHEDDYYTLQWLFAIIYIYIKKESDEKVTDCFLSGLQSIFIQDTRIGHQLNQSHIGQFKGRELINHSYPLFDKIPDHLVWSMLEKGLSYERPEVRSVCRLLRGFHRPAEIKIDQ
jgi:hypothetical protein